MWSEDTDIGDVACMRGAAEVFLRRAETAKNAGERERFLGYAKLYREMAARAESAETEADDEP
ncbi:MAG TPA: hypothetical protein VNW24_16975 [Stellaceae bacterium]|jgi:hypothetical protein|nr:hypothetical protein [Stellaceae bacterium]